MLDKKSIKGYMIFFIIIIGLIIYSNYSGKNSCLKNVNELNFNGVIVKKYYDTKQHNYAIIELFSLNDSIVKINLTNDHSGIFDYVQKNDSLIKRSGELDVKIYRNSLDTIFVLNKKCI
jgi:hypothetical protein